MPSYFYHLKFELYPTRNPIIDARLGSTRATNEDVWLPPEGATIFDILPAHKRKDLETSRILTVEDEEGPVPPPPDTTPSVIDCGASRPPDPAHTTKNKKFEIVTERRWRERSQSLPPPPSSAAIRPQTAVRDWRFGPVSIESIDLDKRVASADMAGDREEHGSEAEVAAAAAAVELGPKLGGSGPSTKAQYLPIETTKTQLGWGVVHFYREGSETSWLNEMATVRDDDLDEMDCTTLCIPSVPSYLLPGDFLGFVGKKWRPFVSHFRMVMTSQMSRYLVLMKFRDNKTARAWRKEFDGKVFNNIEAQICHVVFIKSITFETPTRPRGKSSDQGQPSSSLASTTLKPFPPPTPNLIELPTCPVCLERMDDTNGLITIPCQHAFHCTCLINWDGSGCPVCRHTTPSHAPSKRPELCSECDCPEDLWICLLCGNIACGRYKGGHAKDHWKMTAHSFALELATQHVWHYAEDIWVHRLIRDKGDGKVMELPGSGGLYGYGTGEGVGGDVVPAAKLENIGREYSHLIATQMESQRAYFEDLITKSADKAAKSAAMVQAAAAQASEVMARLTVLEAKYTELVDETVPQLERDLARERNRATKAQDLARKLAKEAQEEKQVSKGLLARVEHVNKETEAARLRAEELQAENEELKEMNRDLSMFISGQEKLRELEKEGKVEEGEVEGGSVSVAEKKGRRRGKK